MQELFLAGRWVPAARERAVHSPWGNDPVGLVGEGDEALVERAVSAAHESRARLAAQPTYKRRAVLEGISQGISKRRDEFAELIVRESGKPLTLARAEVDRAVQTFRLGAEESARLGGEALSLDHNAASEGRVGAWTRVPAGPVLAISPFNFPLNLVAHKLSPAFALGAPVVLKPAPQTPLTSVLLARVVEEAGAPEGLLSVVPCENALAERMVGDARFSVVSFTGSAKVGWSLRAKAPRARVLLELGGNAAMLVEPDADLDAAVTAAVASAYGYAGQVCIKTQRIYLHASVAESFTERFVAEVRALPVADPMHEATVCGPVIDVASGERIERWINAAVAKGARLVAGGTREGNRVAPAVVTHAKPGTELVDEELFGPAATLHTYEALPEAVAEIDRGRYGLQAGIYTNDLRRVREAFAGLRVGALVVNGTPTFRVDAMPYGGVKDSGQGREGVRYAVDEMSEKKLLIL